MDDQKPETANRQKAWSLAGAVTSAVAASACCLIPLLLATIGVGGAWLANLRALERYHPLFALLSIGLLGFAFYRTYKPRVHLCEVGSECADHGTRRISKIFLWLAALLIVFMLALPYAISIAAGGTAAPQTQQRESITLEIQGMTCSACVITVKKSLSRLDGVLAVNVTLDPPEARVTYDPAVVTPEQLTEATGKAGYPSTVKKK